MTNANFRAAFRAKVERQQHTTNARRKNRSSECDEFSAGRPSSGEGRDGMKSIDEEKNSDSLLVAKRGANDGTEKALPAGFFDAAKEEQEMMKTERKRGGDYNGVVDVRGGFESEKKKQKTASASANTVAADELSGQEYLKQKEEEERMKREEEEAAAHAKELADEVIADTVAGFDKVDALREKAMEIMKKKKKKKKNNNNRGDDDAKKVSGKEEEKEESSDDDDSDDDDDDFAWRMKKKVKKKA